MGLFSKTPKIKNKSIQRLAPKCKEYKIDTLLITTKSSCVFCKAYNRKVFSLYGWNKGYPKIPEVLLTETCPECGVSIGASFYIPGINSKIK